MEIGTETAQFPEKEYINSIVVAVNEDYMHEINNSKLMRTLKISTVFPSV